MPKPPRRDEQKLLVDADKVWEPCGIAEMWHFMQFIVYISTSLYVYMIYVIDNMRAINFCSVVLNS